MADQPQIKIQERSPAYWTATFDHPPLNLVDFGTVLELEALITRIENDPQVRVVVFDSADPEFFLAHFDVMAAGASAQNHPLGRTGMPLWLDVLARLARVPAVTVCSIKGYARGAGSEIALSCDIRFASLEKAVLGQFEVGVGAVPGGSPMARLPGLVGRGRALEILLGADDFPADLAERYGYVNRAVPDAELDGFVDAFAARIAGFDKSAITETKALVDKASLPPDSVFPPGLEAFYRTFARPESRARLAALLQKGLQERGDTEYRLGHHVAQYRSDA
jgi:enoyl-CoA hydratase/carnithine racemase